MSTNITGYVASGWQEIRRIFERNFVDKLDLGASLAIYHRGQCVVDLYGGWKDIERKSQPYTPETLEVVFSLSKGILAIAIGVCVEKGWLDYEAPIAKYWPEFAVNGKEEMTVSEMLSHRGGLPYIDRDLTVDDVCNWSKMIDLLISEKPHWKPGLKHGYHGHTTGYLAGELIQRVDRQHRSYSQFIRDEIDRNFYVGNLDEEIEVRIGNLYEKTLFNQKQHSNQYEKSLTCNFALPLEQNQMIYNQKRIHQAILPAVNGITNARTLARIYSRLMNNIEENNRIYTRLFNETTLVESIQDMTPSNEPDEILYFKPTTFSKSGFQTYGECFQIFGPGVFGHTGYGGSCSFAYPPQELTYAHVCNQLDPLALTVDTRSERIIQGIKEILF